MIDTSTEAVKALMDGVTPGDWMVGGVRGKLDRQSVHFVMRYDEERKRDDQICAVWYDEKTGLGLPDARFIAAARDLVPALLAERDALRDNLDAAVGALETIISCSTCGPSRAIARATIAKIKGADHE